MISLDKSVYFRLHTLQVKGNYGLETESRQDSNGVHCFSLVVEELVQIGQWKNVILIIGQDLFHFTREVFRLINYSYNTKAITL